VLDPLHYAINLVGEEGSEIAKEVCKILRFGLFDVRPSTQETNLQVLQNEVTDLMAHIRILNLELVWVGLPPLRLDDEAGIDKKFRKVEFFANRSIERGTLSAPLAYMSGYTSE
jgi:hypothetical protein